MRLKKNELTGYKRGSKTEQLKQFMNEQEYLKYYEHFFTQQVQMKMTKNQMSS
jgi:hypothetical protein